MKIAHLVCALFVVTAVHVALGVAPQWFTYQGYLEVSGQPYGGINGETGNFKFAIANDSGSINYWANDGTTAGEPSASIELLVIKGLFSVNLGDTSIFGMTGMSPSDFSAGSNFYVRVWFDDAAGSGWTELTPPVKLSTAPLVSSVNVAGDTMTGLLILSGNPVEDFGAATKQYVDSMGTSTIFSTQLLSNDFFVTSLASNTLFITTLISNDFFTLTLVSNSTFSIALASNELFISTLISNSYFSTQLASNETFVTTLTSNETFIAGITNQIDDIYVNEAGDTMSGFLILSGDPTDPLGAVTKQYVDGMGTSTVFATLLLSNELFLVSLASNKLFISTLISNEYFSTLLASNETFLSVIFSNEFFLPLLTNQFDDIYVSRTAPNWLGAAINNLDMGGNEITNVYALTLGGERRTNWPDAAEDISYSVAGESFSTVKDALDALFYVSPSVSLSGGGTYEIGSSIANVALAWTCNKAMTTRTLSAPVPSGDRNQGAGQNGNYTHVGANLTSDTTYSITVGDGSNTDGANTYVRFRFRKYYGVSAVVSGITDNQIKAFASQPLSSSRITDTTLAAVNEYIYIAYPASWGAANFKLYDLPSTGWQLETRDFVNDSGRSESYRIYRSQNLQNNNSVHFEVQ